jgi:hypothetical protein
MFAIAATKLISEVEGPMLAQLSLSLAGLTSVADAGADS